MAKQKPKTVKAAAQQRAREEARAEAQRIKQRQAARDRRNLLIGIAAAVTVVVAAAVVVVVVLMNSSGGSYEGEKPTGASDDGVILIGQNGQPGGEAARGDDVVVVRVYSDYICPICGSVERRLGSKLESLAASGDIRLEIAPISFLDNESNGTKYSTRSTNAVLTVARYAPEQFLAFHSKLFEQDVQPSQYSEGLDDAKLVELAQSVGVPASVTDKFAAGEFNSWIEFAAQKARDQPVEGTPSIWMGKSDSKLTLIKNSNSLDLDDAIAKVREGKDPN
jgi:protein-disulfide isomerase